MNLELNPDPKPFNSRYYPVPRINKEKFRKKIKCLVVIGLLIPVHQSQYIPTILIIHKKEGTVSFIKDYRRLNQKLVGKPYPLPRIGETMQQL